MRIKNETYFDTAYLRKIVVWMRREVELRPNAIKDVTFKLARGRWWSYDYDWRTGSITVVVRRGNIDDLGWALATAIALAARDRMRVDMLDAGGRMPTLTPVRVRAARIARDFFDGMNMKLLMTTDALDMLCAKAGVE